MVPYPGTEVSKMAVEGNGGYRLLSFDWDAYSKQINYSLAFNNISLRTIKMAQFLGYILIFLFNGRILDLGRFIVKYQKAGFKFFWSIFKKTASTKTAKPIDYNYFTKGHYEVQNYDLLKARMDWKKTQIDELRKARLNSPNLLEEQKPAVQYQ
jgi:hypothetical protein